MEELINLKKGSKIIKRSKANYDANKEHWQRRGFSLVKQGIEKSAEIVKLKPKPKPKKKKGKK